MAQGKAHGSRAAQAQVQEEKTVSISHTESLELVRCLLRVSIFHVSYLRGLFPDGSFKGVDMRNLDGMHIKMLMPECEESRRLVEWVENGVYDAIKKGYLRSLFFGIATDPDGTQLLEEYIFSFKYGQDGTVALELAASGRDGRGKKAAGNFTGAKAGVDTENVKYQVVRLMRMLVQVCQTLDRVPDQRYLFMKLTYHDHTPPAYEPPMFVAAEEGALGHFKRAPFSMAVGSLATEHHAVELRVKSVLDACQELGEEGEGEEEPVSEPGSVQSASSASISGTAGAGDDGSDANSADDTQPPQDQQGQQGEGQAAKGDVSMRVAEDEDEEEGQGASGEESESEEEEEARAPPAKRPAPAKPSNGAGKAVAAAAAAVTTPLQPGASAGGGPDAIAAQLNELSVADAGKAKGRRASGVDAGGGGRAGGTKDKSAAAAEGGGGARRRDQAAKAAQAAAAVAAAEEEAARALSQAGGVHSLAGGGAMTESPPAGAHEGGPRGGGKRGAQADDDSGVQRPGRGAPNPFFDASQQSGRGADGRQREGGNRRKASYVAEPIQQGGPPAKKQRPSAPPPVAPSPAPAPPPPPPLSSSAAALAAGGGAGSAGRAGPAAPAAGKKGRGGQPAAGGAGGARAAAAPGAMPRKGGRLSGMMAR